MTYKYPDFGIWCKSLTPIEIAFIILYTAGKDSSFTDIEITEKPRGVQIDDSEDHGSFTWEAVPVSKEDDLYLAVNLEFVWSGGYYGGSSGTYWDPPESGTDYIDSLEVDQLSLYDEEGDDIKVDDSTVNALHLGFTYQNMLDLAISIGMEYAEVEEFRDSDAEKSSLRVSGRPHRTKKHVKRVRDYEKEEEEKKNDPNGELRNYYYKDEVRLEEIPAIPAMHFPDKLKHKIEEIRRSQEFRVKSAGKRYGL